MKKLIERSPSHYCVNLQSGNVLYLSHAQDVAEEELVELDIKVILNKIDELVEAYNSLIELSQNMATTIKGFQEKLLLKEIPTS